LFIFILADFSPGVNVLFNLFLFNKACHNNFMKLEINPEIKYQEPWQCRVGYPILRAILGSFIRLGFVKSVTGLENIPQNGAAILAANHSSLLDFLCLSSMIKRPVHYLVAEVRYKNFWERQMMKMTGQIRVDRLSRDKGELFSVAMSLLGQGRIFGIFPEGRRSRTGEMLPAYTGVAKFAAGSGAPVIPVGIKGAFEVWPRHQKWPKLKKGIEIIIGEPMEFNRYGSQIQSELVYRQITDEIMQRIAGLTGKEYLHAGTEAY